MYTNKKETHVKKKCFHIAQRKCNKLLIAIYRGIPIKMQEYVLFTEKVSTQLLLDCCDCSTLLIRLKCLMIMLYMIKHALLKTIKRHCTSKKL